MLRIAPIDEDVEGIAMTIFFTSAKAMSRQLDVKVSGPGQRTTLEEEGNGNDSEGRHQ